MKSQSSIRLLAAAALSIGLGSSCSDASTESLKRDPAAQLPGGETTNTLLFGVNSFLPPAANISSENQRLFFTGNSYFNQGWVTAPASTTTRDGLGPFFNARSCAGCHFKDGRGAPPLGDDPTDFNGVLLRIGVEKDGLSAPHPVYGGQLQPHSIPGVMPEVTQAVTYEEVPGEYPDGSTYALLNPTYTLTNWAYDEPGELHVSPRVAQQMIGLGLLEAISVERLQELADPEDVDGDGVSGRIAPGASETEPVGRFGWKAEAPSLAAQTAGAFLGDMGITSERHPTQNCTESQVECLASAEGGEFEIEPHLFERVTAYTQLIAVPARRNWDLPSAIRGEELFEEADCSSCHTPRHQTGAHALAELSDQTIFPYTDLLLHDMGEELSDHRPPTAEGGATPQEWRTPPLWGIGLIPAVNGHDRLLHDGRARGVEEAILWHGGEAETSRDKFKALSQEERQDLITFVESL